MKKAIFLLCIYISSGTIMCQNWCAVGSGFDSINLNNKVDVFLQIDNDLYAGGNFNIKGSDPPIFYLAKWNGLNWSGVGNIQENDGHVTALELYNNKLYAGGAFSRFEGNTAIRKLACYDNGQWNKVGSTTFGNDPTVEIYALKVYNGKLYIGGTSFIIGTTTYHKILTWNGSSFAQVSGGINPGYTGEVDCMEIYNGELIMGGMISKAGTLQVNNIVRWDGSQWLKFPGDSVFNDGVGKMAVDTINNYLYVAPAYYEYSGDWAFSYLGRWDGANWTFIESPTQGFLDMHTHNGNLYVSGLGQAWGTDTIIAKWDGQDWELIFGPNDNVYSVCVYKNELYAGGCFMQVDSMNIVGIAKYGAVCTVGEKQISKVNYQLSVFPNPNKGTAVIKYNLPEGQEGEIKVYGIGGELIKQYYLPECSNSLEIDTGKWKAGTYIYSLYIDNELKESGKMVVNQK